MLTGKTEAFDEINDNRKAYIEQVEQYFITNEIIACVAWRFNRGFDAPFRIVALLLS